MTREEKIRKDILTYAYSGEPYIHRGFSPNSKEMKVCDNEFVEEFMRIIWEKFDFPIKYRIIDKTIALQHKNTDREYEGEQGVYESWGTLIASRLIRPFLLKNNLNYEIVEEHGKWRT